jgi:hypothetical protein
VVTALWKWGRAPSFWNIKPGGNVANQISEIFYRLSIYLTIYMYIYIYIYWIVLTLQAVSFVYL